MHTAARAGALVRSRVRVLCPCFCVFFVRARVRACACACALERARACTGAGARLRQGADDVGVALGATESTAAAEELGAKDQGNDE